MTSNTQLVILFEVVAWQNTIVYIGRPGLMFPISLPFRLVIEFANYLTLNVDKQQIKLTYGWQISILTSV